MQLLSDENLFKKFDETEENFISDDELQIEEYNLITTAPELTVISKPNAIIKPKAAIKPKAVSKIEINVTNVNDYSRVTRLRAE